MWLKVWLQRNIAGSEQDKHIPDSIHAHTWFHTCTYLVPYMHTYLVPYMHIPGSIHAHTWFHQCCTGEHTATMTDQSSSLLPMTPSDVESLLKLVPVEGVWEGLGGWSQVCRH